MFRRGQPGLEGRVEGSWKMRVGGWSSVVEGRREPKEVRGRRVGGDEEEEGERR